MGKYTQALEYSQKALAILREAGKFPNGDSLRDSSASRSTARTWEGRTLNFIGLAYSELGQYPQALEYSYSQKALAINREVGDHLWEGRTLNDIAGMYAGLGQYPKTLEFLNQALAIFKKIRQAQIALITGNSTALGENRGLGVQQSNSNSLPPQVANRLSHPYYWAPFILIGNGL